MRLRAQLQEPLSGPVLSVPISPIQWSPPKPTSTRKTRVEPSSWLVAPPRLVASPETTTSPIGGEATPLSWVESTTPAGRGEDGRRTGGEEAY